MGDRRAPMQDLVGVGIADAAENGRIGECALERVIALAHARSKHLRVGAEHFEPAAIVFCRAAPRPRQRAVRRAVWCLLQSA